MSKKERIKLTTQQSEALLQALIVLKRALRPYDSSRPVSPGSFGWYAKLIEKSANHLIEKLHGEDDDSVEIEFIDGGVIHSSQTAEETASEALGD